MFRTKKNQAEPQVLPPIVVTRDEQANEARWRMLEAELTLVIRLMHQLGLTKAGFMVASRYEARISDVPSGSSRGTQERLVLARDAVRAAARAKGTLWSLPEANLYYEGYLIDLFGDGTPGEPRAYGMNGGPARLVQVAFAGNANQ